jgi:hypothetical protein
MANPFPGMNPFLEWPARWPSIHDRFITYLADTIDALLPENYSADINERIYVANPPKDMYPDVFVVKQPRKKKERNGSASTAVLTADPPVDVEFPLPEIREPFIEIAVGDVPGTLIGVIELLSPSNKTPGTGRDLYLEKQQNHLRSPVHLIEIDLLRAGQHTVAIPPEGLPAEGWDYVVCLHRGGWQNRFNYWAFSLQERLPRISVPLGKETPDVVVDLQAVLNRCHTVGRTRHLDYSEECPPPLSKKNAKWVDELLRKKKLRK